MQEELASDALEETPEPAAKGTTTIPVAGIGGSAGGLEVFKQLLADIPADSGLAIVFVQHLDPKHHSLLSEILARSTTMAVREAADGMPVEANHVYVIPANGDLTIAQGMLKLTTRTQGPGAHMPIDRFLRSLEQLTGLDRWILEEFSQWGQEVIAAYDNYEFHVVYQQISQFVAVELSAIYHDVVKDRLYTDPANSPRRRSTQTALHRMVGSLCQMLAPILAFTADEAWEYVPGKTVDSAHRLTWQPVGLERPEAERATWKALFELRELALPELEKARQGKSIGKAR